VISVRGVSKSFGTNEVLSDVSFELEPGDLVGLVGPSGGGKSVLLKIMASVIEPDSGEIVYTEEERKSDGSRDEIHVGFLFQEGALFDSLSVLENVAFPLLVEKDTSYSRSENVSFGAVLPRKEALERAYEILDDVGLEDAWKKYPGQLSGGMRRRVGIARALVSHPDLVLLDDPTGGLDPVAATVIMGLIKDLHAKYSPTIVLASHDIRRLLPAVTHLISLFDGLLISNERVDQLQQKAPPRVIDFLKTRYDFVSHGSL